MHTLLSLGPSNARQGYSVEAEENRRRSSSHPRTHDVTHQLSLRLRRQRADRPLSVALFTLLGRERLLRSWLDARAPPTSVCEPPWPPRCLCVRALIGGHNSRRRPIRTPDSSRSFSDQSTRRTLSLSHVDCRVRIHFIYDATSPPFRSRVLLNLYRGHLSNLD